MKETPCIEAKNLTSKREKKKSSSSAINKYNFSFWCWLLIRKLFVTCLFASFVLFSLGASVHSIPFLYCMNFKRINANECFSFVLLCVCVLFCSLFSLSPSNPVNFSTRSQNTKPTTATKY